MATPDTALPEESVAALSRPAGRRPRRQVRWAAYTWGGLLVVVLGSVRRQRRVVFARPQVLPPGHLPAADEEPGEAAAERAATKPLPAA